MEGNLVVRTAFAKQPPFVRKEKGGKSRMANPSKFGMTTRLGKVLYKEILKAHLTKGGPI